MMEQKPAWFAHEQNYLAPVSAVITDNKTCVGLNLHSLKLRLPKGCCCITSDGPATQTDRKGRRQLLLTTSKYHCRLGQTGFDATVWGLRLGGVNWNVQEGSLRSVHTLQAAGVQTGQVGKQLSCV